MTVKEAPLKVPATVRESLRLGCSWHGHSPSACCECDTIKFWQEEIAAGRAR